MSIILRPMGKLLIPGEGPRVEDGLRRGGQEGSVHDGHEGEGAEPVGDLVVLHVDHDGGVGSPHALKQIGQSALSRMVIMCPSEQFYGARVSTTLKNTLLVLSLI